MNISDYLNSVDSHLYHINKDKNSFANFLAENGVNILEFLSCWTDTLFIIDSKDVNKAITFLKF